MNISSIVVKTTKEHLQQVIEDINSVDCCETHFSNSEGKIVVTIEGDTLNEQMEKFKIIQSLPFVLSTNLSYSYCEDELMRSMGEIKKHKQSGSLD